LLRFAKVWCEDDESVQNGAVFMSRCQIHLQVPGSVSRRPEGERTRRSGLDSIVERLRAAGCVFAEDEARLLAKTAADLDELAAMVCRRVGGEPLEQVLGWAEFCGLRIRVEPGVFIPRRRSELLVREAAAATASGMVVLDLCCGSGAVGAALADRVPGIEVYATDIDRAAVRCARKNLADGGGRVYQGSLFDPLPAKVRGRVGLVAANPPYVPSAEVAFLPAEARQHEPLTALDGGGDGLDLARRILVEAPAWLAPRGRVVVETSERQAGPLADFATNNGLTARVAHDDTLGATALIAE
jgi:release factor glutamine methyltransferase